MIPVLSKIHEIEDLSVWQTSDNRYGIGFEISPCDIETDHPDDYQNKLVHFLKSLNPNLLSRIKMCSKVNQNDFGQSLRGDAIKELGAISRKLFLFIETENEPEIISKIRSVLSKTEDSRGAMKNLIQVYEKVKQSGLSAHAISKSELIKHFEDPKKDFVKSSNHVHSGCELTGVIRLIKPKPTPISEFDIANILKNLPSPIEVTVSIKRLNETKMKLILEKKLRQSASASESPTDIAIGKSTHEAISETLKKGSLFFDYEFLVLIKRDNQELLNKDLNKSLSVLAQLGDFKIETVGCAPSFLASLLGNSQYVSLREVDDVLPLMLPVWWQGELSESNISQRSLSLHRKDKSLHHFDMFNSNFSVFNTLIIGTSGKGKSVLAGLLTRSLLMDPNIKIIKIDVGGSHSKECEIVGGTEFVMQLNSPSGINPFEIINNTEISIAEKTGVLSKFISVLIQETGEIQFSKDLRSQIEECIQNYIPKAKNPSLQEFYEMEVNFPRRNLLKRWTGCGIYAKAFATPEGLEPRGLGLDSAVGTKSLVEPFDGLDKAEPKGLGPEGDGLDSAKPEVNQSHSRLRYFNFSQIFQASDPEFAQAGIAAVLAKFNYETMIPNNGRIVLICDETPFFIKSCFEFFKFSTANVRKFGHAVVLISQLSSDLIHNGDTGLIENSPQRFLFSSDGDLSAYQQRFGLSDQNLESIQNLKSIPRIKSEVFLQTANTGRKLNIEITKKEYWELTSSQSDKIKLQKLRALIPELNLEEAIKCLSVT